MNDIAADRARTDSPVVEIASGKLRGARQNSIASFKSIPYGASTAGRNRFMPPQKPAPWAGVRDALAIECRAPQAGPAPQRPELATVWGPVDTSPMIEDCLRLHVWTPGLGAGKRPVMVWLHGGAFSYGSPNTPRVDGSSLARRGDVVVVSVVHRLNIFGHLHLAQVGGSDFARSGNVGVLDLVAALEWVRDNIAAFGGDPGNVTIFGQSGGGGKVSALCGMPAARGLFHKGIVQSGSSIRFAEPDRAAALAEIVLQELGLGRNQLAELQQVPVARMLSVIDPATKRLPPARQPLLDRYPFGPVVGNADLPAHPFEPTASDLSDNVPLMIGGTAHEAAIFLAGNDKVWFRSLNEAELKEQVAKVADAAADRIIAAYRAQHPRKNPAELLNTVLTGSNFWVRAAMQAERKAAKRKAPVYMYDFAWEAPGFDGRLMACHSVDVPFVFDTVAAIGATAGTEAQRQAAEALAARVSATWIQFARTGDPNHGAIPAWPAYTPDRRATLVFNAECRVVDDPDREARIAWSKVALA
jgi:para-nitrobenzyl esterase